MKKERLREMENKEWILETKREQQGRNWRGERGFMGKGD